MANEYWVKAYDSGELAASATSVTISSLDGNTDEEYELIVRGIGDGGAGADYGCRPNNDTGSNYGYQRITGIDATAAALRNSTTRIIIGGVNADDDAQLSYTKIYAKSGYVRTALTKTEDAVATTTVYRIAQYGHSWNNTADNITSLVVYSDNADGFGVGSRIILLKKASTGTPAWQKVSDTTLGSAATTYTFSSLNGNADVIYRLMIRGQGVGSGEWLLYLNNDSGSNYGFQDLTGINTTVGAYRTAYTGIYMASDGLVSNGSMVDLLLYAKSGYARTALNSFTSNISATTVSNVGLFGNVWTNTADNLTSIVVNGGGTEKLGIGTYFCLEKLAL